MLKDCPCRWHYLLKTIPSPCNRGENRNSSKVAGPPTQKTSFTVTGALTMWAQRVTVEYQKGDLSLLPVGVFCIPLLRNLKMTQFRRLSNSPISWALVKPHSTKMPPLSRDTIRSQTPSVNRMQKQLVPLPVALLQALLVRVLPRTTMLLKMTVPTRTTILREYYWAIKCWLIEVQMITGGAPHVFGLAPDRP